MQKLAEQIVLHTKSNNAYVLTKETAEWHKLNAVANIDGDSFETLDNDTLVELDRELTSLGVETSYRKFRDPITMTDTPTDKVYEYLYIGRQNV